MCSFRKSIHYQKVRLLSSRKPKRKRQRNVSLVVFFDQGIGEPQDPIEAYFWHSVGMEFREFDWTGEGFVDAVAHQEILAAKLPHLVNENSSLHKRAKEWIRMHRAFLPEEDSQNGECFDDDFDEIDNEQD